MGHNGVLQVFLIVVVGSILSNCGVKELNGNTVSFTKINNFAYSLNISPPLDCIIDWQKSKLLSNNNAQNAIWPSCEETKMNDRQKVKTTNLYKNIPYTCTVYNSDEVIFGLPKELSNSTAEGLDAMGKITSLTASKVEYSEYNKNITGWNIWDIFEEDSLLLTYKLADLPFTQLKLSINKDAR